MRSKLVLMSLALTTGLALGAILLHDSSPPQPGSGATSSAAQARVAPGKGEARQNQPLAADIVELEERLQHEIGVRRALEQRVQLLTRQVATLLQERPAAEEGVVSGPTEVTASAGSTARRDWFDEQRLIETGMDRIQASQLRAHFEQLELERLQLRNQSLREGWDRRQLREALRAVARKEVEIKDQLGEAAYDAYRYAAGLPNRVAVTSVLASAQAGEAGILPGDYIMRYDNERIYDWFDLQEATAAGEIGEMVSLEVERDGETLQFYLQRGPLGIRMDSVSIGPEVDSR